MTAPPDLAHYGKILYGEQWRRPLAAALGVTERTIYRREADPRLMPWDDWRRVVDLLDEASSAARKAATRLSLDIGMASAGEVRKRPPKA